MTYDPCRQSTGKKSLIPSNKPTIRYITVTALTAVVRPVGGGQHYEFEGRINIVLDIENNP